MSKPMECCSVVGQSLNNFDFPKEFEKEVENFSEEELKHIQDVISENLKKRKQKRRIQLVNNVLEDLEEITKSEFFYDTVIENYDYSLDWEDIYNYISDYLKKVSKGE